MGPFSFALGHFANLASGTPFAVRFVSHAGAELNFLQQMPAAEKVIRLRQLLAERFPAAHIARRRNGDTFVTHLPRLDEIGLPKGELTEIVSEQKSSGVATLVAGTIESALRAPHHVALIDGRDSFDPRSVGEAARKNLLWIRCRNALEATKATDLVLRDGNLPFLILDLRANPVREIRRLGSPIWYRLQTLGRHSSITCLVLTPAKIVSSARLRITIGKNAAVADLDRRQDQLIQRMEFHITRRREDLSSLSNREAQHHQATG